METQSTQQINQTECIRCGTCCKKGGPALHSVDYVSVKKGAIDPTRLYTVRIGELVRDNVKGGLFYAGSELIKIQSAPGMTQCIYYSDKEQGCIIYPDRPAQCRAMKCWDISAIANLYAQDRLGREAIFGHIDWLWDLIGTHENHCGYEKIRDLAEKRADGDPAASRELSDIVAYDISLRDVVVEKGGIDREMLDLVFGRPLKQTLPAQFGIRVD
ncbi:MAG: YkgJ family cysteine cluster protein [Thermodesulfobacteriota bacterium]